MTNKNINDLPVAGALDGTEPIEVIQGGVNVQTTTQDIADLGGGGGGFSTGIDFDTSMSAALLRTTNDSGGTFQTAITVGTYGITLGSPDVDVQFNVNTSVGFSFVRLTEVNDPVSPQDVATKNYVDTAISQYGIAPSDITPTGSPFSYTNSDGYDEDIIISGGTVSLIEFSRDEVTYYDVGLTSGMFRLSKEDTIRITYTVAPTVTKVPR